MRTTAAVDDVILWLAAGILALLWLGMAGASFGVAASDLGKALRHLGYLAWGAPEGRRRRAEERGTTHRTNAGSTRQTHTPRPRARCGRTSESVQGAAVSPKRTPT